LGTDRPTAIGGVGRVECFLRAILEFNKTSVFDAVGLGVCDRKNDALAQLFIEAEEHLDIFAIGFGNPTLDSRNRGEASGWIDGYASICSYGAGSKRQR